jgi:hypothetical protein
MVPFDIKVPLVSDLKPGSTFEIDLQNSGKTAALDPLFIEEFAFWDRNGGQRSFHFTDCPIEPSKRAIRFGSLIPRRVGNFQTQDFALKLNADQRARLQAHTAAILVHACMWYGIIPAGQAMGLTDYCSMAYLYADRTFPCPDNRTALK